MVVPSEESDFVSDFTRYTYHLHFFEQQPEHGVTSMAGFPQTCLIDYPL